MLRTTVYLREDLILALRRLSLTQGRAQAELIRDAIHEYVQRGELEIKDKLPPGVGAYRSGRADISANVDRILRQAARKRK